MGLFWFKKKIDTELLKLSQIAYGGEFYYNLKNYKLKELKALEPRFKKISDTLLKKIGNNAFYSYKNEGSGFVATLFENVKTRELVIAYRGTERIGMGENSSDLLALGKDIKTDLNLILCNLDQQFYDAFEFFNIVKIENPKSKITILGQSLGGALAQLVGAKVYSLTGEKVKTYTYNAPGCKHILEIFNCNPKLNYSFITNYAVMNDWCGMFGEKIGETYLIPPIPPIKLENASTAEILENVLLKSHEGIFDYCGTVIKKPKDFNQSEGLSLWYYDSNNPMKSFEKPSEFIKTVVNSTPIAETNLDKKREINPTKAVLGETERSFQQIIMHTQEVANDFLESQKKKFIEELNNSILNQIAIFLDGTFSQISEDSLDRALKVLKEKNIHKTQKEYYNSFKEYIKK